MENSTNKLMMMTESSKAQTEESCPEESSWTFYIQDFPCGNTNQINDDFVCFSSSSSLINNNQSASLLSDAASSASKKPNNYYKNDKANFIISSDKNKCDDNNKAMMTLRKRIVIQGAIDEDLQDTATSPVNSPKVMKRGDTSGALLVGGKKDDDITELKKRELCLVPISSSISNYYGL
ncbi:hypothetical protein Leryth_005929 [Lithospermum erythrorhizon]|nr:hypothetical protein Leryth_005929 [Lithospermum erythrorhizon]